MTGVPENSSETIAPRLGPARRRTTASLFDEAQRQPMLTPDEERDLARRSESGDETARNLLVTSHLRFVIKIARGYRHYGLPMNDLVQEGMIGLLRAVRKFSPERDVRFATYAMWWIRAAIQAHVVENWSLVKIGTTSAQKSLFFGLKRKMAEMSEGADALSEEFLAGLARRFEMPIRDLKALAQRVAGTDPSLNAPETGAGGGEWIGRIAGDGPSPEETAAEESEAGFWSTVIERALAMLPEREALIIRERFLAEAAAPREAIARQLGISKERVRQLELRALEKLHDKLLPMRERA